VDRRGPPRLRQPLRTITADIAKALIDGEFDLIVIDSLAEVVAAIKDGSLRDGILLRRLMRMFREIAEAGAAVIVVAHASEKVEKPETTLGASEQKQAITGQEVLVFNTQPLGRGLEGKSLIYITKDRQSATADDVDVVNIGARAHRRLWGELELKADTRLDPYGVEFPVTTLSIWSAKHTGGDNAPSKLDLAETAVIAFLTEQEGRASSVSRIVRELTELPADNKHSERTVRRAVDALLESKFLLKTGETVETIGRPSPIVALPAFDPEP
jgi:hypothetical protein